MAWYTVVKTIKGRRYLYRQRTWREGRRVRSESIYIGSLDGGARRRSSAPPRRKGVLQKLSDFIEANWTRRHGMPDEEEMLKQYSERVAREAQERQALADKLYAAYGMKLGEVVPTPVDKAGVKDSSVGPTTIAGSEEAGQVSGQVDGAASEGDAS